MSHDYPALERILDAAQRHGEVSEPEHELGDVVGLLREAWRILRDDQRTRLWNSVAVQDTLSWEEPLTCQGCSKRLNDDEDWDEDEGWWKECQACREGTR